MVTRKETTANWAEKKEKRRRDEPFDEGRATQPKSSSCLLSQRFYKYTLLSVPWSQILIKVKDQGYFQDPPQNRTLLERKNQGKYYHFHRNYGHNIDECRILKDEIEAFICKGHMSRYVAKKAEQPKAVEEEAIEQPQDNRLMVGVISTICGGTSHAGNFELELARPPPQSKKARVHDSIAFSYDDLKGMRNPHDDLVVISL